MLAACGRPLSTAERSFAEETLGPTLDAKAVRIVDGALVGEIYRTRPPRPYVACRHRIRPEETEPVRGRTAALVLGETMYTANRIFAEDFLPQYPQKMSLPHAMLLAHEMVHVWQWQNRELTGYAPTRAAAEQVRSDDPYLFELDEERRFLDYGYEQQGAIMEEFVCCRALDPEGARTERLYAMLSDVFPGIARQSPVPLEGLRLPKGASDIGGICN